jgi:hypothetical protein
MREYKIKRGHDADIQQLVTSFFGAKGDIFQGIDFSVEGIGDISMKQEKKSLFIEIVPPKKATGDYSIIKKWNNFLYEATGKDSKERKKDFSKL